MKRRVLVLGGTAQARELAVRLAVDETFDVVYSLAGVTRRPVLPRCTIRTGGFGGVGGLKTYLTAGEFDRVVNATHPFAERMSQNAVEACRAVGLPLLRLVRAPWMPGPGDRWIRASSPAEAAYLAEATGARIFLTTGRKDLAAFAGVTRAWFLVRLIEEPDERLPLARYAVMIARPPFRAEEERTVMKENAIDVVVTKNSGGDATAGKLVAARDLRLPVIMIERPEIHRGDRVETVDEALSWLSDHRDFVRKI